ncbi:ATP-binding protein [Calothrix sp. PCC 7507]|uniref:sensor histidine kinase n=1 Tax=Calothrix sp. PCC 7507 TaxID=99598 RepID=UPI00029ED248|nr:ATP-binding protein [Calothrix sp. PCC 7507]AFY31902.1 Cache sensor signal transduction histidine kinase [Calothrix sp. PCC 7507]
MILASQQKLQDVLKIWRYRLQLNKRSRALTTPLILIGTTLAISVIAITSYKIVREIILQQVQEKALLEVRQGADKIDQWLAIRSSEVKTIANTKTVRSLNWSEIEPYLQPEIKRINEFFVFGLTYPDGSFYTTEAGKSKQKNNDRDYIQKGFLGQVNISDPFIGRTTGLPAIAVASPIYQSNGIGVPKAVIFASLKVDRVTQVVNKLKYGKNSYAFALNSQGYAIAHPNPELISTAEKPAVSFLESPDPNLAAIARHMLNKELKIALIHIDGTSKYVAHVPLKQANWSIALVIPRQNIESQLESLNILASILGGLLVIATVIGWRQIHLSKQTQAQVILLSEQKNTLRHQAQELEQTLRELKQAQSQLIHTEKMSSLGQLVAGVAHEINNPVSFIYSNIAPANDYIEDLLKLLQLYQQYYPQPVPEIEDEAEAIDIDFLATDLPQLLASMKVGAERIKEIVLSLRNFSRLDEADMKAVNIHEGIDSTLMILESRFKATSNRPAIEVNKQYGDIPNINCYAGQLNQVFINILTNAIDAIEESFTINHLSLKEDKGQIRIHTEITSNKQVIIRIVDNGLGIPENIQQRLFDPFFTTKPVGKGTGLGLSISYQIVTEKHQGKLECISALGKGTEFAISIPLHQSK